MLSDFIKKNQLPSTFLATAKQYYQPFADNIAQQATRNKAPYFVGVNGCQGSGKSTLTQYIGEYLSEKHELKTIVLSLDDFYLSREERDMFAHLIHPLLNTRGVPGTHNIKRLKQILTKLKQKDVGFRIPRFNKATDNPYPENEWQLIEQPVDVILLEGWCWGAEAQSQQQLMQPVNELEFQLDSTCKWRMFVNQQLTDYYQPLYKLMNYWLLLKAPSFDCVYKWRLEQENKLRASLVNLSKSKTMNAEQVLEFIQHFQRLTVQSIKNLSDKANAVFVLNNDRLITQLEYR